MPGSGFQNKIVFAENVDFSGQIVPAETITTNGQLLIGTTSLNAGGTHINVGHITSPDGSINVGFASPNITLTVSGSGAIDSIGMQIGVDPVTPIGGLIEFVGQTALAGTTPVQTEGLAANIMALNVQISQELAAPDVTKIGLSNFDSADFSVDSDGFVSLVNPNPDFSTVSECFDDFLFILPTRNDNGGCFNVSTQGLWDQTNELNHPGIYIASNPVVGSSIMAIDNGVASAGIELGNYEVTVECMMKMDTLSSAGTSFFVTFGLNTSPTDPNSAGAWAIYFSYNHGVNGGNWTVNCREGAAVTTGNTTTAADTDWHRFKIVVNAAGTSVSFFIDNVEVTGSPLVANITTLPLRLYNSLVTAGGIGARSLKIDYWYSKMVFTR